MRFTTACSFIVTLLSLAFGTASAAAQPFAYVANDVSRNVTVIDAATQVVVATIDVGAANLPASVAVSPLGDRVYVANNPAIAGQGTVSVIDTATNAIINTITTGGGPYGIAITPDGRKLYITNFYAQPANNVIVIDTATQLVTGSIVVGSFPHGLVVTPNGNRLFVTNAFSDTVSVIDTTTDTVAATIPVGGLPHGIAINPAGTLVYVTNHTTGTITVIDANTLTSAGTITLTTAGLEGVTFTRDGSMAYVAHQQSNFVSIIDVQTGVVIGTITVGANPFGMALTPAGDRLFVANQGSASVSVIDIVTNTVIATIPTAPGSFPENLAFTPEQPTLHVCLLYDPTRPARAGSTIPIRLQLCDESGANISSPTVVLVASNVVRLSDEVSSTPGDAGNANPDSNFRYDSMLGQTGGYVFNLSTLGLATGTYRLEFVVGESLTLSTLFQVK